MPVTLKEIADIAGVSPTTVSFALRGKKPGKRSLSPKTIAQICTVAKDLGYRSNRVAASLASNKTNTIGVLIAALGGDFYERILAGIKHTIYPRYVPLLAVHNYEGPYERAELETFIGNRVDGVIAAFSGDIESVCMYREMAENYNIPVVLIDRSIPGLDLPVVQTDHYSSSYEAVKALHKLGHKKILYAGGSVNLESGQLCKQGYLSAMHDLCPGSTPETFIKTRKCVCGAKEHTAFAKELLDYWENLHPRATAILVKTDWFAYRLIGQCQHRKIKIPDELSVMGIDDCNPSSLLAINLSTVRVNNEMVGYKAAELLQKIIEGRSLNKTKIVLPAEVVMRKTTKAI